MTERKMHGVRAADHVGFAVASLADALRFWIEGLGGELVSMSERDGAFLHRVTGTDAVDARIAIVDLAGQRVELLEYRGGPAPAHGPAAPFDPGAAHLALIVDDLDGLLARVAAHGWQSRGTPEPIPTGPRAGTRVIYVTGPDGATVEFMEPPAEAREACSPRREHVMEHVKTIEADG